MDIDLGSGGISVLADLEPSRTATPRLMVVGGKQGNAYLLDRERLPGRLDRRPECGLDAATDGSLLPPSPQPQFGGRGPRMCSVLTRSGMRRWTRRAGARCRRTTGTGGE